MAAGAQQARAYAVLAHEAMVDSAWDSHIEPMLRKRFPAATPEQLREAHAHAYGGCLIQDMGYYPFGSRFFTDLVHYVRAGDFIEALLDESQTLEEYAFALGALAHHPADNHGHPLVNRAVPIAYPKLRAKHGNEVTYAESPSGHLKTEFGFDVVQVARGNYAPEAYRDFIGFKVSKPVLERAFLKTYGLEMKDVFLSLDLALGSYRRAVSTVIPQMTKVAWETRKEEITQRAPGARREKFLFRLSRKEYEKQWGSEYQKPGFGAKLLAFFFRVMPKIGPFKALAFKPPGPEVERLFLANFEATAKHYRELLDQAAAGRLRLPNRNFDTGEAVSGGAYSLADEAYAKLIEKHAGRQFAGIPPETRAHILAFYSDLSRPFATKKDPKEWAELLRSLAALRATK